MDKVGKDSTSCLLHWKDVSGTELRLGSGLGLVRVKVRVSFYRVTVYG